MFSQHFFSLSLSLSKASWNNSAQSLKKEGGKVALKITHMRLIMHMSYAIFSYHFLHIRGKTVSSPWKWATLEICQNKTTKITMQHWEPKCDFKNLSKLFLLLKDICKTCKNCHAFVNLIFGWFLTHFCLIFWPNLLIHIWHSYSSNEFLFLFTSKWQSRLHNYFICSEKTKYLSSKHICLS